MLITCYNYDDLLDPSLKKDAIENFISLLFDNIYRNGYNIDHILDMESGVRSELFDNVWKEFRGIVLDPIAQISEETGLEGEDLRKHVEEVYPKFNNNLIIASDKESFLEETKNFLASHDLNLTYQKSSAEESNDQLLKREEGEPTRDGIIVDTLDIDPRDLIPINVRLLLATLPKLEKDENGESKVKESHFGMGLLEDYDHVNRILLNTTKDILSLREKFQKLDDKFLNKHTGKYSNKALWIPVLKQRLNIDNGKQLTLDDLKILAGFDTYFTKMQPFVTKLTVYPDGNNLLYDPVERDNSRDIITTWKSNVIDNIRDKHNDLFLQDRKDLTLNRKSESYKNLINTNSISKTPSERNLNTLQDKLGLLGINFKANTGDLLSHFGTIYDSYIRIIDSLQKKEGNNFNVNTFDQLFEEAATGRFINLARIHNQLNPQDLGFMCLTPEGEPKYTLQNTSTLGKQFLTINKVSSVKQLLEQLPYLNGQHYFNTSRSRTVQLLFDENGNKRLGAKYELGIALGVGQGDSEDGASSKSLTQNDRILQEVNNILRNIYTVGINSDKNTEWIQRLSKPYLSFSEINKSLTLVWMDMLRDEMDAAWQEIYSPSNLTHYKDNVWKFGYFRNILTPNAIRSFIHDVLGAEVTNPEKKVDKWEIKRPESPQEGYEQRSEAWISKNWNTLDKLFSSYLDNVTNNYLKKLGSAKLIKKNADKDNQPIYKLTGITKNDVKSLMDIKDTTNLSEPQMKSLVRFIVTNYEVARNEQNKLHFGHPANYKDPVKRMSMWMGIKTPMTQDKEVLERTLELLPRTDKRIDTISDTNSDQYIRNVTYSEPLYMQEGYENLAQEYYNYDKSRYENIKDLEQKIGAEFKDDKFHKLILKNNKPTGYLSKFLGTEGANSQQYFMYDFYWRYRFLTGDMSAQDWKLREYDWAYDVYHLGNHLDSTKKISYDKKTLKKAQQILEKYNNIPPVVAQGIIKPQYAGYSDKGNPTGLKVAARYICYRNAKGTIFEDAYITHKKAGVDSWGYPSGEKMGLLTKEDGTIPTFFGREGGYSGELPPIQYLSPEGIGKQTEITEHDEIKGSQEKKQQYADFTEGMYDSVKESNELTKELAQKVTQKVLNEAGLVKTDLGYVINNPTGIATRLRNALAKAGVVSNQLQAINVVDKGNGLIDLETSFDAMPIKDAIEHMLWSIFNDEIINPRQFGKAAMQTPELGLNPVRWVYLNPETGKYEYVDRFQIESRNLDINKLHIVNNAENIQRIEDDKITPVPVALPWAYNKFKVIDDETSEERSLHPRDLGLVQGTDGLWQDINQMQNPDIFKAIPFRIPTGGLGSIYHAEGYGFHDPTEGEIISIPASVVARDDSDFDGDKSNGSFLNMKLTREGRYYKLEPVDPEESSIEGLKNKLWNLKWQLFENPERYVSSMTPITTGDVGKHAKEIRENKGLEDLETNYTAVHQLGTSQDIRKAALTAKNMIGVVARASTMHILSQIADIRLTGVYNARDLYFLEYSNRQQTNYGSLKDRPIHIIFPHKEKEGQLHFGGKYDAEGNNIGQNISNRLQAILEAAKDNSISQVGLNRNTISTAMYLTELGVPDTFIHNFFSQPIILQYVNMRNEDNSLQTRVNNDQKWRTKIVASLIALYSGRSVQEITSKPKVRMALYSELLKRVNNLKEVSLNQLKSGLTTTYKSEWADRYLQMALLIHFLRYEEQSKQAFNFNQWINADTANSKTFDENTLRGRYKLKMDRDNLIANPEDIMKKTFIGGTVNSTDELQDAFKNYFVSMDDRLQPLMQKMLNTVDAPNKFMMLDDKKKVINRFRNFILDSLINIIPNKEGQYLFGKSQELIFGKNSLAKQLASFREKYPENTLLQNLQPLLTQVQNSSDTLRLLKSNETTFNKGVYTNTILRGYRVEKDAELKNFYGKLAEYSILQTGLNPSRNSIQSIVPHEIWLKTTKDVLDSFKNSQHDLNYDLIWKQFFQNNYGLSELVPRLYEAKPPNEMGYIKPEDFEVYEPMPRFFIKVAKDKTDAEFVKRINTLERNPQKRKTNQRVGKANDQTLLYQKIDSVPDSEYNYYRRINTLGKYGDFVEVTPYSTQSLHPENFPFNENAPEILNEIKKLQKQDYTEKSVSLPDSNIKTLDNLNNIEFKKGNCP